MSRWLCGVQSKRLPPVVRLAASTGVKAPVESYLRAGRDPDATDAKDRTLLLLAAAGGSADVCRLLLESGADPSRRDAEGSDALTVPSGTAIWMPRPCCGRALLRRRTFIAPAEVTVRPSPLT